MLASAPVPPPTRQSPAAAPRRAEAEPHRSCPYCRGLVPAAAKKCAACGEWIVRTTGGLAAALLRVLAWGWAGVTVIAAAAVWYGGELVEAWVIARAVDPVVAPVLVALAVYGMTALVLLQGLTVTAALRVLARMAPRRPRRWG